MSSLTTTMVSVRLLVAAVLLCHQSTTLAERLSERLFFKDQVTSEGGSRRTVQAGEDVVLECEAAGRPSPAIHWLHEGVRLKPVVPCVHCA